MITAETNKLIRPKGSKLIHYEVISFVKNEQVEADVETSRPIAYFEQHSRYNSLDHLS